MFETLALDWSPLICHTYMWFWQPLPMVLWGRFLEQRSEALDVVLSLRGLLWEGAAADAAHTPNLRRSWHVSRG